MIPIAGFVILAEGDKFLGQNGGTTADLESAWDSEEFEAAEAKAIALGIDPIWVAEYVVESGQRQLAYAD